MLLGGYLYKPLFSSKSIQALVTPTTSKKSKHVSTSTSTSKVTTPIVVNACNNNTVSKIIIVSIDARHLWACDGTTLEYNSPVVTGMDFLAADITPTGTFYIQDKQTNIPLKGCDSTGCWDDPVHYWMQFLYNQYGAYGLHDATWRPANAFGNISPSSHNASHGCVELPLATAAWLYNWTSLGTEVQINNS
jgi:lipoprotein-anchoring transpeptidase ErfK/SrfK